SWGRSSSPCRRTTWSAPACAWCAATATDRYPAGGSRGGSPLARRTFRQVAAAAATRGDELERAAAELARALEDKAGVGVDRRRQLHAAPEQQRHDDQLELVERAEAPVGLDRGRPADQVHIATAIRLAHPLEQALRVAVDDDVIRRARRPARREHEHVQVGPRPAV